MCLKKTGSCVSKDIDKMKQAVAERQGARRAESPLSVSH